MVKSPMEYFESQDFSPATGENISPAEAAFIQKYLGIAVDAASSAIAPAKAETIMAGAARQAPPSSQPDMHGILAMPAEVQSQVSQTQNAAVPIQTGQTGQAVHATLATHGELGEGRTAPPPTLLHIEPVEVNLQATLRTQEYVTMVGFYLCGQVFVIPIDSIMEVLRYEPPSKLPRSSQHLLGVINLRGHITPIVSLSKLLVLPEDQPTCAENSPQTESTLFIICESQGLHIGLHIDKLHTMHKAKQEQIEWNAETQLGESAALLLGLFETGENLLGIISVEKIVQALLEEDL